MIPGQRTHTCTAVPVLLRCAKLKNASPHRELQTKFGLELSNKQRALSIQPERLGCRFRQEASLTECYVLSALSVRLLCFSDLLIDRLTAGEALCGVVPLRYSGFSQLPAEEHDVAVNFAGEVEESDI
jgi:hypothetical protein